MKKKVAAIVSVLLLVLMMLPNSAFATGKTEDMDLNTNNGLRAIVSTMVGTGNPPPFTLSATSPDRYQVLFSSQIHPYNSCFQAEVIHERFVGGATTHKLAFYNWCGGSLWGVNDLTNATFRSKYVRTNTWNDTGTAFQDENIDIRVYNDVNNNWLGQAYNYNTGAWDTLASISGNPTNTASYISFGDDGVENASGDYCPTLYPWGIAQIRGIQKFNNVTRTWSTIGSGDIQGYFQDPNMYCFTNNVWQLKTPNPWQFKIVPYGVSY